jgi:hypothetical protein
MSIGGFISAVSSNANRIISDAQQIVNLPSMNPLQGGVPSSIASHDYTTFSLGPVNLVGFEIPRDLPLGGDQRTVVNEFIGKKKRSIQAMGAQPRPLHWEGAFLYASALDRARFLESLMIAAQPIDLVWGDYKATVIIDKFYYEILGATYITYEIDLNVVKDLTDPQSTPKPSLDTIPQGVSVQLGSISGIISSIQSFLTTTLAPVNAVEAAVRDGINDVVGLANTLVNGVGGIVSTLSSQPGSIILGFQADAAVLVSTANSLITSFNNPSIIPVINPTNATQSTGADPMVDLLAMSQEVQILAALLARYGQPPLVASLTVVNDNLFAIASRYYNGNLEAWSSIADFNGLTDAQITGPMTLLLPPVSGVIPKPTVPQPGTVYESNVYPVPPAESPIRHG